MHRVAVCALLASAVCGTARAGQVYGVLREQQGQPVVEAPVSLTCGQEERPGKTDQDGVYRLLVSATGGCTLVLEPNGRKARGSLYSYDRPTGYDFVVVNHDGTWVLEAPRK